MIVQTSFFLLYPLLIDWKFIRMVGWRDFNTQNTWWLRTMQLILRKTDSIELLVVFFIRCRTKPHYTMPSIGLFRYEYICKKSITIPGLALTEFEANGHCWEGWKRWKWWSNGLMCCLLRLTHDLQEVGWVLEKLALNHFHHPVSRKTASHVLSLLFLRIAETMNQLEKMLCCSEYFEGTVSTDWKLDERMMKGK